MVRTFFVDNGGSDGSCDYGSCVNDVDIKHKERSITPTEFTLYSEQIATTGPPSGSSALAEPLIAIRS